jgi:hypothetical protein
MAKIKGIKAKIIVTFAIVSILSVVLLFSVANLSPVGEGETNNGQITGENKVVAKSGEFDYFQSIYGLDSISNFKSLNYQDLINLLSDDPDEITRPANGPLKPEGDFIILFGGEDGRTKALAPYIDDAAKKAGKTIYVFDPRLDGGLAGQIVGSIPEGTAADPENAGKTGYAYEGADYLYDNLDIETFSYGGKTLAEHINSAFTSGAVLDNFETPLLFSVKRTQTPSRSARLRSKLNSPFTGKAEGYVLSGEEKESYFQSAKTLVNGAGSGSYDPFLAVADLSAYPRETNNTHLAENDVFVSVGYGELIYLLGGGGQKVILIGGAENEYTSAVFEGIQKAAKSEGYGGKIFVFDPRFTAKSESVISGENKSPDGRTSTFAALYAYIYDNYLHGYQSRWYGQESGIAKAVGIKTDRRTIRFKGREITKIAEPALFLYSKGILESFEAELKYIYDGAASNSGTQELLVEGANRNGETIVTNLNESRPAYKLLSGAAKDLFYKAGLYEAFEKLGYTVSVNLKDIKRTVAYAEREKSRLILFSYPNSEEGLAQQSDTGLLGIGATSVTQISYYYLASQEAKEIIAGYENGSIYTAGIVLDKPNYDKTGFASGEEAAPEEGGGQEPPAENGGGAEIC